MPAFFTSLHRKWWVLAAMICSFAMVFIDQTAIPVALPAMQKELNTTSLMLDWVVNAYLLTLAALTIVGGKAGDIYGHRLAFLSGLFLFTFSSVLIGFAPSAIWAVLGRALQGIGGAFMVPAMSVVVSSQFPQEERGKAIGILVGSAAVFASAGPLVGGLLTEYITWRAVFWINIPFALTCFFITMKMVPSKLHEHPQQHLDWLGAFVLLASLFLLIFSLMEAPTYGWGSHLIWGGFIAGTLLLGLFIWIELHQTEPLIELGLFKYKQITVIVCIFILFQMSISITVFWAIYFQDVLRVSPAEAGLMMMPVILPAIFMPTVGGRLKDIYGAKLPVTLGAIAVTSGMLWVMVFAYFQNYLLLLPGLILVGMAGPLVFSSATASALQAVEMHKRGVVSGICGAARQIGMSLGIAVLGSLMVYLNKSHVATYLQQAQSPLHELNVSQLDGLLSGAMRAKKTVSHLSPATVEEVFKAVKAAHVFSFSVAMAIVFIICLVILWLACQMPAQQEELNK
jgi:EmrB/QacA subfamily drug resistance transporter